MATIKQNAALTKYADNVLRINFLTSGEFWKNLAETKMVEKKLTLIEGKFYWLSSQNTHKFIKQNQDGESRTTSDVFFFFLVGMSSCVLSESAVSFFWAVFNWFWYLRRIKTSNHNLGLFCGWLFWLVVGFECKGFFYKHFTTLGTNSFTSPVKVG